MSKTASKHKSRKKEVAITKRKKKRIKEKREQLRKAAKKLEIKERN